MDINTLSFVLSIVGLLLGFISAYAQIKNFSLRALKAGKESSERWLERVNAETDFYIAYPSALIAHITYRVMILLLLLAVGILILKPSGSLLPIPEWATSTLRLALAFIFGNIMSGLSFTARLVVRRAKRRHVEQSGNG